jgi:hypothetical protein
MPGECRNCFLPHNFQFIIHLSYFRSTLYILTYWRSVVKETAATTTNTIDTTTSTTTTTTWETLEQNWVHQHGPTGGSRATSGPRSLITTSAKLCANLFLDITRSFFIYYKEPEKIAILISSGALRTSATHAINLKTFQ